MAVGQLILRYFINTFFLYLVTFWSIFGKLVEMGSDFDGLKI